MDTNDTQEQTEPTPEQFAMAKKLSDDIVDLLNAFNSKMESSGAPAYIANVLVDDVITQTLGNVLLSICKNPIEGAVETSKDLIMFVMKHQRENANHDQATH